MILNNVVAEAGAEAVKVSISSSYETLPAVYVSRGLSNGTIEYPSVVCYVDETDTFANTHLQQCNFNVEVTQYATDTTAADILCSASFAPFIADAKTNFEADNRLFIYVAGDYSVADTLDAETGTWTVRFTMPVVATLK